MNDPAIEKEFIEMVQRNERLIYKVASFYADANAPLSDLYQEVVLNLWKGFRRWGDSPQAAVRVVPTR